MVPVEESVAPSKARPDPMRSVFTPAAPLPAKMPESVVLPVPPYTPERVVVAETTPLIAWRGPVRELMVTPPLKVLRAVYTLVVEVANDVEKTPVAELYCRGASVESDEELILLLKRAKSVFERKPLVPVVAWVILIAFPVRVSGVLKVRGFSRPRDEVAVRVYEAPLPTKIWPKVGVVEIPVPPPATARVPVSDGVSVKAPAVLVIASAEVRPLVVEVVVPKVIAPVCAVPEVCATEVTPVLVMTPVDEL